MTLPATFAGASERHWSDGCHLDDGGRAASADHLYGFAAECAIKAILLGIAGVDVSPAGSPVAPFRTHVDQLWPLASGVVSGLTAAHYAGPLLAAPNPFSDWSIDDRYAVTPLAQSAVAAHRAAATAIVAMCQLAEWDGLL